MAVKAEVIKNEFDIVPAGSAAVDKKIERNYLRYVHEFQAPPLRMPSMRFAQKTLGLLNRRLKTLPIRKTWPFSLSSWGQ
jgi:hypothetical protein